ncbi:hypothetical protein ZEAMMB73_Zm00001d029972 [Zea mays]|uniref:Ubiquitin-like protease family profile domain-containing protein n=1 Tax=Zea mays TaxID=4577 RepID=A0A1D6K8P7_MAIZE|nr:hypothetical protein ZEAMMB73_Zm00001d029972 [Zea mays]
MLPTLSTGTTSRNTLSPGHPGHLFATAAASSIAAASASSATSGGNEAGDPTSAAADDSAMTVAVRWRGLGFGSGLRKASRVASLLGKWRGARGLPLARVFIPINIRVTHWYLAVINARNMEIQVLDSLGTTFERNDLTNSPLREINMGYAKQTDGSSCGLFLLNYIEYWTGDELSNSFTQDDMSHFRKKLAAILLSSYMNKRRGYLIYKYDKEVHTGSPSDVEILDSPTNHKKRKLLYVLDNSEVLMEDEDGPITQADLQRWFVDEWDKTTPTKVSADGCTDDFLMSGLSTKDMPVTKADLIDVLCDYIMAIQDDRTLEPKGEIIKNRKHYMDMRFWRMIGFGKLPKYHEDPTTEELTKTLDCWPSMNYYIMACKYVLMPWKFNDCYALFVIDHGKKHITFIDFAPIQDWCKHMPYKRFKEI